MKYKPNKITNLPLHYITFMDRKLVLINNLRIQINKIKTNNKINPTAKFRLKTQPILIHSIILHAKLEYKLLKMNRR